MVSSLQPKNPESESSDSTEFRMIGPRSAGKTAYLAALAYWPNAKKDSPIESIIPMNDETKKFIDIAENILKMGSPVAATYFTNDPDSIFEYEIKIAMNSNFNNQEFKVSCKDFAGELFSKLESGNIVAIEAYLQEYAEATGLLIMLDGTSFIRDTKYFQGLVNLQSALASTLRNQNKSLKDYRIAVVWSKAEQPGMWNYRHRIPTFMNRKYTQTDKLLSRWKREWKCSMNYFFCSAFGVKGKDTTPNVKAEKRPDGVTFGVIDNTEVWQPFGLIAPIYWLYTGRDISLLRDLEG